MVSLYVQLVNLTLCGVIKRRVRAMMGFKAMRPAARLSAGIETMHMIKKG